MTHSELTQASETYLESLISHPRMTSLVANRAGNAVLSVQTLDEDGKKYETQLFSISDQDPALALTPKAKGVSVLHLAESGNIYFTDSNRENPEATYKGANTVWKLGRRGEAQPVLDFPASFESFFAIEENDNTTYYFLAADAGADIEEAKKIAEERDKTGASAILHTEFPTRYWDHDLASQPTALWKSVNGETPAKVNSPVGRISNLQVNAQGTYALLNEEIKRDGIHQRENLWGIDLTGSQEPKLLVEATEEGSHYAGEFNPSGRLAFLTEDRTWRPGVSIQLKLSVINVETGEVTKVARDLDRWPSNPVWLSDTAFAFVADNLGATALYRGEIGAEKTLQITDDTNHYSSLNFADGKIFALSDSHKNSAFPVAIDPVSGKISELNAPAEPLRATGTLEKVVTTAEDGTEIIAWLALPETQAPEAGYPMLTFAHGGPWGSWNSWTYRWNPWVFTQAGYAVLLPEPAISTGYGQHMLDRGGDNVGGTPYHDIMELIAEAEKRSDIDESTEAFMGGSYGGYMTNWAAGHAGTKFKAYVTHASLWNMMVQNTATDNGIWHEWMIEGFADDGQCVVYSPHQFADQIQAPMLVIHGDNDYRVPLANAHQLWMDLHRYSPELGHQFLYFPDENHWILKPANSRVWYQTIRTFLDDRVLGEKNELPLVLR